MSQMSEVGSNQISRPKECFLFVAILICWQLGMSCWLSWRIRLKTRHGTILIFAAERQKCSARGEKLNDL